MSSSPCCSYLALSGTHFRIYSDCQSMLHGPKHFLETEILRFNPRPSQLKTQWLGQSVFTCRPGDSDAYSSLRTTILNELSFPSFVRSALPTLTITIILATSPCPSPATAPHSHTPLSIPTKSGTTSKISHLSCAPEMSSKLLWGLPFL